MCRVEVDKLRSFVKNGEFVLWRLPMKVCLVGVYKVNTRDSDEWQGCNSWVHTCLSALQKFWQII